MVLDIPLKILFVISLVILEIITSGILLRIYVHRKISTGGFHYLIFLKLLPSKPTSQSKSILWFYFLIRFKTRPQKSKTPFQISQNDKDQPIIRSTSYKKRHNLLIPHYAFFASTVLHRARLVVILCATPSSPCPYPPPRIRIVTIR